MLTKAPTRCSPLPTTRLTRSLQVSLTRSSSNPAQLADILQNHIISGEYSSSQLAGFPAALTLTGNELSIQSDGSGGFTIGGANVESADVQATNGTIHVIDSVILPSSSDQTGWLEHGRRYRQ